MFFQGLVWCHCSNQVLIIIAQWIQDVKSPAKLKLQSASFFFHFSTWQMLGTVDNNRLPFCSLGFLMMHSATSALLLPVSLGLDLRAACHTLLGLTST